MYSSERQIYRSRYMRWGQLCTHTHYTKTIDEDNGDVSKTSSTQSIYGQVAEEVEDSVEDLKVRVGDEIWGFEAPEDGLEIVENDRITDASSNTYSVVKVQPVRQATTIMAYKVWLRGDA